MQQFPTPPRGPNPLPDETVAALRAAIAGHTRAPADHAPLRAAVTLLARDARARAVSPEQLVIGLKAVWQSETSVAQAADRAAQTRLYEELISHCIREYFGET